MMEGRLVALVLAVVLALGECRSAPLNPTSEEDVATTSKSNGNDDGSISDSWPTLNPGLPGPVAPTYNISLDDDPSTMWSHIIKDFVGSKQAIVDYFDKQVHNEEVRAVLEELAAKIATNNLTGIYPRELVGIADAFGIDLGVIVLLNFAYELRHLGPGRPNTTGNATASPPAAMDRSTFRAAGACTSIVAQSSNYSLLHGRNLDWNIPDELKHLVIQVDVYEGGVKRFTGTTIVGYVGFLNGVTAGGFSISMNERDLGGSAIIDSLRLLRNFGDSERLSPGFVLREDLSHQFSYDEALSDLMGEPLSAPVYFIIAGLSRDQGAVITRERASTLEVRQLISSSDEGDTSWFVLETNYDPYSQKIPAYDDRRKYGLHYMQQLGRSMASTKSGLLSVLNTWPVRNDGTAWTTLMVPATGYSVTYQVYNH